jgi:hypothetical protein
MSKVSSGKSKQNKGTKNKQSQLTTKAHELFTILRRFVYSNAALHESINETFENAYLQFLTYIPVHYHTQIIQIYDSIAMLIGCIDFNKLSGSLKVILSFNLDFGFDEFDVEGYFTKLITNKCSNDPSKKQLLLSLVGKSKPIVNCIKYIVNHLDEMSDVISEFAEVSDSVF